MKGAKGFARDRKTAHKATTKKRFPETLTLQDDKYERLEHDTMARKARRSSDLAEKRRHRREDRDTRRAKKNASALQRTVRELMKELPTHPMVAAANQKADSTHYPKHTPSVLQTLQHIDTVLTETVPMVVAEWDHVDDVCDLSDTVAASVASSHETVNTSTETLGPLQRLKSWLW